MKDYDDNLKPVLSLCRQLQNCSANGTDRAELAKELVENEWINEEHYERMLKDQMLGIIRELEGALFLYKGLQ